MSAGDGGDPTVKPEPATGPAPAPHRTGPGPRRQPLFILSTARSYSTVTVAMLAGHPDIFGFPEMLVFTEPTVGALLTQAGKSPFLPPAWINAQRSGILRAVAELHEHSQADTAIERARAWLTERSGWSAVELMDHLLELVHPRLGLEKSPETIRNNAELQACFDAYPNARFIHLVRHPVHTQRSMREHWGPVVAERASRAHVVAMAASAWYLNHSRVVEALAGLPRSQWIRLRAEDLLREPDVVLPQVLDWLRLPCSDEIIARMRRTDLWPFAGFGPSGLLQGGDPKFFGSPALRPVPPPGPVEFDPELGLPDEMCRRMKLLASYLGY